MTALVDGKPVAFFGSMKGTGMDTGTMRFVECPLGREVMSSVVDWEKGLFPKQRGRSGGAEIGHGMQGMQVHGVMHGSASSMHNHAGQREKVYSAFVKNSTGVGGTLFLRRRMYEHGTRFCDLSGRVFAQVNRSLS